MKINLRESLNKIDLATDNKYDLLNTFDSKKLSDENKKKLAEAIENNSMASVNKILHESEEQLYKVVISSGATKRNFESALYEDEAEEIVDYYGGRWIDENGFEWNMYIEEDDDSTEHAMVDDSYDMEDDERAQRECVESLNEAVYYPNGEIVPEDSIDMDKYLDYNFGKDRDKDNSTFTTEEKQRAVDYWFKKHEPSPYDESLTEASYGGAYDIEDDMFFTKEDIVEFADNICEYLGDVFGYQYSIDNVYMDGPRKLYINIFDNNYIEIESTFDIDMRKIRKPSYLFKVYGLTIENWFQKAFAREYRDAGLEESLTEDAHQPWVKVGDRVKIVKNKHWTKAGDEFIGLTGTVEDYNWVGMQKRLSITLDNPFTGKYGYREFLVTHVTAAEDEVEIINDLTEDTIKQNGKWVNKGSEGTHGKFRTKKAADAQRKAMFARGFKGESLNKQKYSSGNYFLTVEETGMGPHYSLYYQHPHSDYDGLMFIVDGYGYDNFKEKLSKFSTVYPNKDVQNLLKNIKKHVPGKEEYLDEQINLPGYAVKYTSGYSGNGVNSGKTEWFRTKEERDRRAKELKDKNYTEIKTWKIDNFYHTPLKNESLKEDYDKLLGYNILSSTLKDGGDTYALLRKTEDGKTKWAAAKYVNGIPDEDNIFEITYEQARGFEPLTDTGKISRKLGKTLLPKKESLKEDFDDEYETDFDDNEVKEGNHVFADGEEYVWVERIAGPIYLDFDKWAVWSAREYVDPREFMTIHDNGKDYDFDGDAFKKKAMAAPIVYFVVEEDTGFIDWGPVESRIEAQDFLNGKQEDWDNDEYYGESLEKNLNEWYVHTLHYEDIGDGREYDYEVDHEEVLDYLSEIAIDEEDAPEDTEEYLKWVEDNFDELFNKYEYEIEEHFREDASQEEYDRRHSSYKS